ncbi:hypothetical protein GV761_26105, partial [Citrobacter werkmanii]|uniref:hypothetical protein n=1 Tax=Citrobacter werkmanii TaxID=67827 RepID=UPI001377E907
MERIENMVFLGVSCQNSGWSDMSKINRMVWGYKKVVSLISKRNEIRNEIFKRLKYDKQNNLIYDFTPVDVQPYYQEGMKVTEAMIKSIDDVLIDMSDFLDNINISINIALPLNSDDIILPNQMRNQ